MKPVKRPSSRVIVLDEIGRVLLLGVRAPDEERTIWLPPGGGAEAGEDPVQTALRELYEETGLVVARDALGRPVAATSGFWTGYDGTVFDDDETYFALRVEAFTPYPMGFTPLEHELVTQHRWWSAEELDATGDIVFPVGLAALARRLASGDEPDEPLKLKWR